MCYLITDIKSVDCSTALSDAGFDPPPMTWHDSLQDFVFVAGYTDIFTHTNQAECPVTNCVMLDPGCLVDDNVRG